MLQFDLSVYGCDERRSPEYNLICAVLERAIRDARLTLLCNNNKPIDRTEALEWIHSNRKHPWTFLWCCEHIGIKSIKDLRNLFPKPNEYTH